MHILESGEDYLEAILMLSETKDGVHAIDICEQLKITKPSVSVMLKRLREDGYITIDNDNHIHLTEKGLPIAEKVYDRHKYLTNLLISIGVSRDVAEDDACKIEHDLSDETYQKIKEAFGKR
jgi:Mn-dependent DtxR family transcriptional regulator